MSVQIIIPSGNVGKDIEEFSFGQGGTGIRFDVAVTTDQRGEQTTRWYKIACFGKMVEKAQTLMQEGQLVTGSKVMVMGAFNPRDFTTRNGETRTSFDVVANFIDVISAPRAQQAAPNTDDWEYTDEDDDAEPNF